MSLVDRSNSTSKKSPSSLLAEPERPPSRYRTEHLPQHSPSSLLPEAPKLDRDPDLENAPAVSPSSLLPPEPQGPLLRRQPDQLPQHGPSSLLPEAPNVSRAPLFEKAAAVSPSSLLPQPEVPILGRRAEPLPQQGPSSLLPEAPVGVTRDPTVEDVVTMSPSSLLPSTPETYRQLAREELVTVSPSELLPSRPPSLLSKWINGWTLGAAGAIALVSVLAVFFTHYRPTTQLIQEAVEYANSESHNSAVARLNKVLQRQPGHAEARYLRARSKLVLGDAETAEADLRQALAAGWSKREVQTELARALLRQGKYQALLGEITADTADSAADAGKINALRGLAHFALGNESEARTAFETSLSQSPENANALIGLARIAERGKRFEEADRLVERAVRAGARNADGWLLKGELQWR